MPNFPTSLDNSTSIPNPTGTNTQNNPDHAALHSTTGDAVKAVEAKLGIGASTPVANTFLFGTGTGTSAWTVATSAQIAAAVSDETGSGSLVFATTPTLVTPKVDTINESTPSNGVTVGGVNLKSGVINTAGAVNTTSIAAAAVTANKLATGAATSALLVTDESTSSTTYVDLATTTDTVTVTIGSNGLALLTLFSGMYNNTATGHANCSFAASGANTIAASGQKSIDYQIATASANTSVQFGATFLLTGLAAGSTTFKMKYVMSVAGIAHFFNRQIAVVPL